MDGGGSMEDKMRVRGAVRHACHPGLARDIYSLCVEPHRGDLGVRDDLCGAPPPR